MTDRQSADVRNDREKINRARQAAEELFKPTRHAMGADLPTSPADPASSAERQPRRQPRIFAIAPLVPTNAKIETPAGPKPARQRKTTTRRETAAVPFSQVGRIRALASYGMTRAQVAELYGVTVDEIDRIIKPPAYSGKIR